MGENKYKNNKGTFIC